LEEDLPQPPESLSVSPSESVEVLDEVGEPVVVLLAVGTGIVAVLVEVGVVLVVLGVMLAAVPVVVPALVVEVGELAVVVFAW
jgi:hypothetical protein